ncbi:MAG: NeuD/PglB/VioB family sugar acetyltransferase [Balneola sp.]
MKKIVIIGGRGNGTVIASTIEDCKKAGQDIECTGFLNDNEEEINGYPVLGGIQNGDWKKLSEDHSFIYAMSNIKQAPERYKLLQDLGIPENRFATIIHPSAVVSDQAKLGHGVVLMPLTLVSPDVVIGNHSQLYAQSFVGHDTTVDEMVFVANNVSIGGRIHIKDGAHIGSNSSILERLVIGKFAVVGLGSVVLKDISDKEKVVGNPGRSIGTL